MKLEEKNNEISFNTTNEMIKKVWLTYDLGIKGDYPGLYRWLDIHNAKECGNSVAFFSYEYENDLFIELADDLKKNIEFKNGDRIYIVSNVIIADEKKVVGKFIIGNRKASPWEGYAPADDNTFDF